jgi:hypothetical protein
MIVFAYGKMMSKIDDPKEKKNKGELKCMKS